MDKINLITLFFDMDKCDLDTTRKITENIRSVLSEEQTLIVLPDIFSLKKMSKQDLKTWINFAIDIYDNKKI